MSAGTAGVTAGFVFEQMAKELSSDGADFNSNGRMRHGTGLRLTEPPSIRLEDNTVLQPGLVLCLEHAFEYEPGNVVLTRKHSWSLRKGPFGPKQLAQLR
nr:hypothetical protein [Mesorhizobium sp.]